MTFEDPDGGSVWSIGRGDYLIERWDTLGVRRAALRREVDWFVPFDADGAITPDGPPPPTWIRFVEPKDAGRLWVVATIPREDWREVAARHPDLATNLTSLYKLYDWKVELMDLGKGEPVASQTFHDIEFASFLGNDQLVSYREDESGYPFLDVWCLRLEPPPHVPLSEGRGSGENLSEGRLHPCSSFSESGLGSSRLPDG